MLHTKIKDKPAMPSPSGYTSFFHWCKRSCLTQLLWNAGLNSVGLLPFNMSCVLGAEEVSSHQIWSGMIAALLPFSMVQTVAPTTLTASIHLRKTALMLWEGFEARRIGWLWGCSWFGTTHAIHIFGLIGTYVYCMLLSIDDDLTWSVSPFHYGNTLPTA